MSLLTQSVDLSQTVDVKTAPPRANVATIGDYVPLMKPRVLSLVVFTAFMVPA